MTIDKMLTGLWMTVVVLSKLFLLDANFNKFSFQGAASVYLASYSQLPR
jgi:hypothetical protein